MTKQQGSGILLGMIMLEDEKSFDVSSFVANFETHYSYIIKEPTSDNASFVFHVNEEMAAIAHTSVPIPSGDIERTAQYAYNWQTALEDTKGHKSHSVVSILQGGQDQIRRFKLFTQILCSLLRTTNSIGVYKGNQSLLIPKDDYLSEAELMDEDYFPLNLWVYFGLRVTENGNSGYTYGLREFNKDEFEVVNSSEDLDDIRGFLFNTTHYALEYGVTFQDGQTIGSSEEEKILISYLKGQMVEGDTFKFAY
jgi:hypothetical protein